jgi:death-on-curing protein
VTVFLDREDVLVAATAALGTQPTVSDYGLLESAVARPRTTAFGLDAYPTLLTKAAALMQSLARNHALVDGNKRTAWAAAWTFLTINGIELCPGFDIDAAELLVLDVATGSEDSVEAIAEALGGSAVRLHP